MGHLIVGARAVSDSFTGFLYLTPHNESPCQALIYGEVISLNGNLIGLVWLISMGEHSFPEEKQRKSGLVWEHGGGDFGEEGGGKERGGKLRQNYKIIKAMFFPMCNF